MVETRDGTQTEKIEVSNSTNSKPPQFNGKKGDAWTMWRMKYEADQGMKGFLEALQPKFASKLPMTEEADLDLQKADQKKQSKAVETNRKAMMQSASAFNTMPLMNKLACEKRRDKDWLSGKAHRVWAALLKEYEPEDTMAEMELKLALNKLKLGPSKDPNDLLNELAAIECRYSLELTDSKKKAQVMRLGGKVYASVIATTTMIHRSQGKVLTCETLLEEMHTQWRLGGGKRQQR